MSHLNNFTQINTTNNVRAIDPDAFVIREREFLFKMGDQLDGIYRVNSGSVKLYRTTVTGDQQIIGFYMAGDLIGMDALADGVSRSTAVVLETSNVSLITFDTLLNREGEFDYLTFIHQVGDSFNRDNDHTMMLSNCTADRRLAWFLTKFSDGLVKRGQRAGEFTLPMKRADIALYLGMAVETLSREFARLCKKGLVKKYMRSVELLDIEQLRKLACGDDDRVENNSAWTNRVNGKQNQQQVAYVH